VCPLPRCTHAPAWIGTIAPSVILGQVNQFRRASRSSKPIIGQLWITPEAQCAASRSASQTDRALGLIALKPLPAFVEGGPPAPTQQISPGWGALAQ